MKKPFSKLFGLKNKDDIIGYTEEERNNNVESIHIERIVPNRYQPRQVFEPNKIKELAESIEEHGLLQPIVVRPIEEDMFEIIAGERRFRALQSLHKPQVDVGGTTQNELAKSLGKSQSFIANKLRLLKLAPNVIKRLREGKITERHARAVLVLPDETQEELIEQVISQKLNVKQTEDRVRQKTGPEKVKAQTFQFSQDVTQAKEELGKSIETIEKSGIRVEQKDKEHE
ncbi:nucleoid occlusion protein, partial [Paenibacillus macerans]